MCVGYLPLADGLQYLVLEVSQLRAQGISQTLQVVLQWEWALHHEQQTRVRTEAKLLLTTVLTAVITRLQAGVLTWFKDNNGNHVLWIPFVLWFWISYTVIYMWFAYSMILKPSYNHMQQTTSIQYGIAVKFLSGVYFDLFCIWAETMKMKSR